jgi:FixJ family two-component response regulator
MVRQDNKAAGTVLLVEDDAAVRNALKFALELEGFSVRLYDGPTALLSDRHLPRRGCLVVDFQMPVMDGLEMIEVLRARDVRLPAVIIASHLTADLRQRASRAGIDQVLEKPLSDSRLVESIRAALPPAP